MMHQQMRKCRNTRILSSNHVNFVFLSTASCECRNNALNEALAHNTNAFAMASAEGIIYNPDLLNKLISDFNEGRKFLIEQLDANGYEHKGEAGNFIFIKTKTDAEKIVSRMKIEKKILIKSYSGVGNFGVCLRVSIGEKKYMMKFFDALVELDRNV